MKIAAHASPLMVAAASLYALAAMGLGYVLLGMLPMFLFAFGFLGGLLLWLLVPSNTPFAALRAPFFLTLAFFIVHKLDEHYWGFFPALAQITGVPVPASGTFLGLLLYALAAAWLLAPSVVSHGNQFGYYLAWSFFTAMGVTELAHFAFPLFTNAPYGYFPGMASAAVLVPSAWWGMYQLGSPNIETSQPA